MKILLETVVKSDEDAEGDVGITLSQLCNIVCGSVKEHSLYCSSPFSITVFRSSELSFPRGLPWGGRGAPGTALGAEASALAPQVT